MEGIFVIKTCLSSASASSMEGIFMIKNVSVKLFNFFNGGIIDDQERVCETIQFLQWRVYWWPRTCLSNSSVSSWREYWWSRTCLSNSSASLMEGVLVIKNVSVKLFSSLNGECIGVPERVCQTLQLLQRRVYWWSRTCLQNPSVSPMECVQVIKNVSVKVVSFFNGRYIRDQERVWQTLQRH